MARQAAWLALVGWLLSCAAATGAELIERSRHVWTGPGTDFGGFSALAVTGSGAGLWALSDRGVLFRAAVARDGNGRITAIETLSQLHLKDNHGKPVSGFTADAEAMALAPDGSITIGFEGYVRIARFRPPDPMPEHLSDWDRFRDLWGNEAIEALAFSPTGGLLAILEVAGPDGSYATLTGAGDGDMLWRPGPPVPAGTGGFAAVDATFDGAGRLYLLERRHSFLSGFATRVRRIAFAAGRFGASETLLLTAPGELDNMEGISLWTDPDGQPMVTLIADDNFRAFQKTLIIDYALRE